MNHREELIRSLFPQAEGIPQEADLPSETKQQEYLVNGELRSWDRPVQQVLSPVYLTTPSGLSPRVLGSYPLLTEKEALEALDAAVEAYADGTGPWVTMPVQERIEHVEEFTHRALEKKNEVVRFLMWEIGKPYRDAEKEFDRTIGYIGDTIEALKDLDRASSRFVIEQGVIGQIRRAPLGVVLCMGPYNYPLNETFTTLIPALIMGNTVVFKPPRLGVLLHYPLLEAFKQSFPKGVVNSIYGQGQRVVGPLMSSERVDVLAFIGSSGVADVLKKQHPKPHRLRCVLGLEAKNAAIVLPDADMDVTISECILGALSFNGQRCTALKILFVHSRIVDAFLDRLARAVGQLKLGMPWEKDVDITPMPEPGKVEYLTSLVEDALSHGAAVVNDCGGATNATFFHPAVLYPVSPDMRVYREEQFGPVIPVVPFDDLDVPVRYVINSDYGQQVSVFGRDIDAMGRLIDLLVNQVCRVNINSQCQRGPDSFPFTGRKDSAEGTLSTTDALRVFSIRTLVAGKENLMNKDLITGITRGRKSNFLSTDFIL